MFNDEHFVTVSGVILSRKISGENNLSVTLFLKKFGLVKVSARKSSGDSEPFIWGNFYLQKKHKGLGYSIKEVEVFDDMFDLRKGREKILTALNWFNLLKKYLIHEHPDDDLLTNLYWNMKLLTEANIPVEASDWRFKWHWLKLWGLAPDLVKYHVAMKFNNDEILLLAQLDILDTKGVINLFSKPVNKNVRENVFKIASKLTLKFLDEK